MRFVKGALVPTNAQAKNKITGTLVNKVCTTCILYCSAIKQLSGA